MLTLTGAGCPVCSVRCRHSSNLALPPTTRKSAVLLGDWGQRSEPETIQDQWKRCCGVDCFVGSGIYDPASPYTQTSSMR